MIDAITPYARIGHDPFNHPERCDRCHEFANECATCGMQDCHCDGCRCKQSQPCQNPDGCDGTYMPDAECCESCGFENDYAYDVRNIPWDD